jgi:hypothetical protein
MILYRTAGPWGSGTGANLTAAQVDGNFHDVAGRVQYLELHPPTPIQISSFTSVGNQLYIYMSDGTVQGPLAMPEVRWYFRGQWLPNTVYAINDVFNGPDTATYIVMTGHTSNASFNAADNDGHGHNYYSILFTTPASNIPTAGGTGYVLTKRTANSYDMIWTTVPPPPGGDVGQVLVKFGEGDGEADWNFLRIDGLYDVFLGAQYPLRDGDYLRWSNSLQQWTNQPRPILNVVRASSWNPVPGDEGTFMVLTNGTTLTKIIIPNNNFNPFPIGSELHVHQDGTGVVTIEADVGVTILKHVSFSNQLLGQYATVTVKKTDLNEWRLFGLLAGA